MPSTMRVERARRNFVDETNRYDAKRDRLVRCARKLGEEGNASKVSVTDVTHEMGITRGLFYYYFGSKDELNRAVADSYISDLVQAVDAALCEPTDDRCEAIRAMVACVWAWQYADEGGYRPMQHVLTEIGMHDYVRREVSEALAQMLIDNGFVIDYGKGGDEQLTRRVRLVTMGLLGEVHLHEDETIDELADAACAALRYRRRRKTKADAE